MRPTTEYSVNRPILVGSARRPTLIAQSTTGSLIHSVARPSTPRLLVCSSSRVLILPLHPASHAVLALNVGSEALDLATHTEDPTSMSRFVFFRQDADIAPNVSSSPTMRESRRVATSLPHLPLPSHTPSQSTPRPPPVRPNHIPPLDRRTARLSLQHAARTQINFLAMRLALCAAM